MTVNVRRCDIEKAISEGGTRCPIAISIRREHSRNVPCMASDWIWVDGLGDCPLPAAAMKFIRAFDRGQEVKPFGFAIQPVKPDLTKQVA